MYIFSFQNKILLRVCMHIYIYVYKKKFIYAHTCARAIKITSEFISSAKSFISKKFIFI